MSGLKVVALVQKTNTHIFVSSRITTSIHNHIKFSKAMFKIVNSAMKLVVGEVTTFLMKIGNWYVKLYL